MCSFFLVDWGNGVIDDGVEEFYIIGDCNYLVEV